MSYAEVFQYFKFAWLLVLVALYAFEHRSWQVSMWLPVFAYLLADDALQFHERFGQQLVGVLGLTGAFGLRAVDFGELIVTGAATLVLMIPLIVGYVHSDARSRWIYRVFLVLVGVLAFFGVALDMLHIILGEYGLGSLMAFLEDGGEMLSVTAMVAFALRINLSGGQPGFALPVREHARAALVVARRASGAEH